MTQEAFKTWWYNEGSQAPYTHHDCEEHTMRMCEIAWANGAYKALAEHAMQEVQRLGQEIEQEPVAWMDADGNVSDNNDHKCFPIPLYTFPPQRTWVGLTEQEHTDIAVECGCMSADWVFYGAAVERKVKEKNT